MDSLETIAARIRRGDQQALLLDANALGKDAAELLLALFPSEATPRIEACRLEAERSRSLILHGTLQGLEPRGNVSVRLHLRETDANDRNVDRVSMMLIEPAEKNWLASRLETYLASIDGRLDQVAGTSGSSCLFSSIDGPRVAKDHPPGFAGEYPIERIRRGLNLSVELDPAFRNALRDVGINEPLAAPAPGVIPGTVSSDAKGKHGELLIATPFTAQSVQLGEFHAAFTRLEVRLPLFSSDGHHPGVILLGDLRIGNRPPLPLSFTLDPFTGTVACRVAKLLKLADLLPALPALGESADFGPQLLTRLGEITLEYVLVAFVWGDAGPGSPRPEERLVAVAFSLHSPTPIPLVPDFLEIEPALSVEIEYPLSATMRRWTGTVSGKCKLGQLQLNGSLQLPACTFSASAHLKMAELLRCQELGLGTIHFLAPLADFSFALDLTGDVSARLLHARLEITEEVTKQLTHGPALDHLGAQWQFTSLAVEVGYDGLRKEDKLSYWLEGKIRIGKGDSPYTFQVQGGYAGGWFLKGRSEGTFDLARIANDLLSHVVPADIPPGLELAGVEIAADFSSKRLSVRGHTAHPWEIDKTIGLRFNLENFQFDRSPDGITTRILISVEVAGVLLRFLAEKTAQAKDAGWRFEGSTGRDRHIEIGKLAKQFGVPDLPRALAALSITNVAISYDTVSRQLSFDSEVTWQHAPDFDESLAGFSALELAIPNTTRITGTLGPSEKKLELELGYDSEKRLVFLLDSQGARESEQTTTLLAAYEDPRGQPLQIQRLVKAISAQAADAVPASLSVTIKNVLFARHQRARDPAAYLFGIAIDGGLNLADIRLPGLPFAGGPQLPADQALKLTNLQLLGAKGSFSRDDISALNARARTSLRLPARDLNAGVDLSGDLQIGQETKPLALPMAPHTRSGEGADGRPAAARRPDDAPAPSSVPSQTDVTASDGTRWLAIQRSFGPVHLERIGLAFESGKITALLDGGLDIAGLKISLSGLSVTSPLTKLEPAFDLHGLGIDYRNGPLTIGGAFLKHVITPEHGSAYTTFSGLAIVRTETLSLSAIGSYANVKDTHGEEHPSLLLYAVLDYPIGGPPFFFVTGLAAGFGYNRALNMPTLEDLPSFPLVQEAVGSPPPLPDDDKGRQSTLTAELTRLESYIPPAVGEHFLAVGIKFTSFKTIESFALLAVKFGTRLEFDLLGLSTLQSPPAAPGRTVTPVVRARLALKATYRPDEGFLGVQAQLTPDSYILSNACHLAGGFAFFSWFKGNTERKIEAGDFVLSLGGYHPDYNRPDHYPRVPRLAINWQLSKPGDPYELGIKGDGYFALTPHAVMAGGHLEALWHAGNLRAWFNTGADFLIHWKPYHYDAHGYVDIGASYTFELFGSHTIGIDVGADLHLWGPEFTGVAELHCSIFSVTIHFGADSPSELGPITWDEFRNTFLPEDKQICSITAEGGLIRQIQSGNNAGRPRWIVNAAELTLVTSSVIPVSDALSVVPMGVTKTLSSKHVVTVWCNTEDVTERFRRTPVTKSVPAALWGEPRFDAEKKHLLPPEANPKTKPVIPAVTGYEVTPAAASEVGETASISLASVGLTRAATQHRIGWDKATVQDLRGRAAWDEAESHVRALTTPQARARRIDLIAALGFDGTMLAFDKSVTLGVTARPQHPL